jgi:hypothetical protein
MERATREVWAKRVERWQDSSPDGERVRGGARRAPPYACAVGGQKKRSSTFAMVSR